jgi:signal transduction histidine kinase
MTEVRVHVTGDAALVDRIAALDGVTVVDAQRADCAVTTDTQPVDSLPTVAVTDDLDCVAGPVAGFVRPDTPDDHLRDQLRLAATRPPAPDRTRVERLHDITRDIVTCDDPEAVYELAATAAARVLEFDICYIAEAGETYFLPKAMSDGMDEDGYTHEMRVDEGLAGQVYQTGESVLVDDLTAVDDAKPVDADYRAGLSVPIGDVGVFQAVSTTPGAFDERDRELVELLMSHVAETITRLRTDQRLREERRTIERLHQSTTDLIASETEQALCEQIVCAAEGVLEFEVCAVLLADDGDGPLELVAATDSPLAPDPGTTIPTDLGVAGRTFQTGESVLVRDVAEEPDAEPSAEEFASALSVPLGSVGVVQAIAAEPNAYDERDLELAELFVSQAAAVLARIRAERDLVTERDRLEEFASVLSHDLRNPLNVATGYLDLAIESGEMGHLDRVADSLDRMDALVEDVLMLAREPSIDEPRPVDVADHARTAARTVGLDALEVDADLPTVDADPQALLRLLENLLRNSVDHAGSEVTVRVGPLVEPTREFPVGFAVADDGPGIPPDERDCVFDSGYTTGDGTGLGLPIVRSIADAHGWSVSVTESDTGGARFEIRTA